MKYWIDTMKEKIAYENLLVIVQNELLTLQNIGNNNN